MKKDFRKVSFRYDLLNRSDTKIGVLDGITSCKIVHGEFKSIKRSATFELDEYAQREINYLTDQIQPWFILHMPDGGTVEWPLGIFLLQSPKTKKDGNKSSREIVAYDKTIIIEEDRFIERYFIEAGTNYISAISKILELSGISKIKLQNSDLTLLSDREYAIGTKKKEAVSDLLNAINYTSISIDEMGFVRSDEYVEPVRRKITQNYAANKDSIIFPEFVESLDFAGRANVFTRVARNIDSDTELVATVVNSDPASPLSTVSRGRQIVSFEEIENISSQETLNRYVRRIALESMSAYSHLSFETALMPTHGSADALYLYIPSIFGKTPVRFSETSWEMDLKYDGKMKHEARKVVQLA